MKMEIMKRSDFVNRMIRYLLLGILAVIAALTGSRANDTADCSSCTGRGVCSGIDDCSIFIRK